MPQPQYILILTGASDGIGAEMARQLAHTRGARIGLVLAARNGDRLRKVAAQCEADGTPTLVVPTDVGVESQCRSLIARAIERFGHIDALINNAGISGHALFEEVKAQDLYWYEDLMRINLWGSVWCTHAALPYLKASRGRIVAVSSLAGLVGVPGRTAYSTSKFAMTGFFESLRAELACSGVSVTTAYPGVVLTDIRSRGLNAQGQPAGSSGLKEDGAMSVKTCAQLIIHGMDHRTREVVMTRKGKLARLMKIIAPKFVDRMAMAALQNEVKPQ